LRARRSGSRRESARPSRSQQWSPTFSFGTAGAADVLLGAILVAATLESVFAFCIGCAIFGLLMRWGVIPDEVCDRCNNLRLPRPEVRV
jgi:hypothetical protein